VDYTTLDDAALIRLLAYNRSEALGELYNRYARLVFSVALNAIGDSATAEEITQDVFTRAWEKAKTYDVEISKVSTWLISITRNRSIDEMRRGRIRPERYSVSWAEVQDDPADENAGPEEKSELGWQQATVRAAVASLPFDQQQALALAYFKGFSHSEIAETLGEPLGTVKTRIRLGMQKLREILSDKAPL
jgi:RNA polymerase sigma-70 factor (ECF subfamily)